METNLNINSIQDAFFVALANVLSNTIAFIPTLLAAILVIFVGLLVSRWTRWAVIKLLETLRLSQVIKNSPVEKFLEKAEISNKIEYVVGNLVRWLILLVFFITATNIMGLTTVSGFLNSILNYIPVVFSAALILTVGVLIAGLVESLVKGSLTQISPSSGRLVGKVASYVVMIFTIMAAFIELNIAEELINSLFIGFVAMLALGLGLAFGLGAKDLVGKILEEWYTNFKKDLE